mmetsp:Transcript_25929/g.43614  ORF Transcript_25929/g.43614 Transcript_25929/m.43614 type:complete len:219 (+) Transcript_25929:1035-1691(+)
MTHYLLGVLVMFPDFMVKMKDSKVITSNTWSGSKITMTLDVEGTKMFHLPPDAWLPKRQTLPLLLESSKQAMKKGEMNSTSTSTKTPSPTLLAADDRSSEMMTAESTSSCNGSDSSVASSSTGSSSDSKKRKRKSGKSKSTAAADEFSEETMIPMEYVMMLTENAVMEPEPHKVRSQCELTMFLDENHHLQHMTCYTVNEKLRQQKDPNTTTNNNNSQ